MTAAALAKEIAVVHAMRSAGTSDFGAASPTDLIQLLLGQSEPAFSCDISKTPQALHCSWPAAGQISMSIFKWLLMRGVHLGNPGIATETP